MSNLITGYNALEVFTETRSTDQRYKVIPVFPQFADGGTRSLGWRKELAAPLYTTYWIWPSCYGSQNTSSIKSPEWRQHEQRLIRLDNHSQKIEAPEDKVALLDHNLPPGFYPLYPQWEESWLHRRQSCCECYWRLEAGSDSPTCEFFSFGMADTDSGKNNERVAECSSPRDWGMVWKESSATCPHLVMLKRLG